MTSPSDTSAASRRLAELGHELRTPLGAILGFADAMRERAFGPLSERYVEHAGLIHDAGRRMLALIETMTDIAQLETGARRRPFETFDARAEVAEVVGLLAGKTANAGVALTTRSDDNPVVVTADRLAIGQILINLADNAIAATGAGGQVEIRVAAEGGDLVLSVIDSGGSRESGRTGLGLTLVRALCGLHAGGFDLHIDGGAGATAVARLPVIART